MDLCFGDDDPPQWPQPWVPDYPHIPCIPLVPAQTDLLLIMWMMPDCSDFIVDDGILSGIGKFHQTQFLKMQVHCHALHKHAVKSKFLKKPLISQLIITLENLLYHLKFISTKFHNMQLTIHKMQRVFLKLLALLDYYEYFCDILLLNEPPISMQTYPPTTAQVMGVFTTDLTVCDCFFQAGIPVWLMRPFSVLSSICMKVLAPVQTPGGFIPLMLATCPLHPTIYCGNSDHINKYWAIECHV